MKYLNTESKCSFLTVLLTVLLTFEPHVTSPIKKIIEKSQDIKLEKSSNVIG